VPVYLYKCDKCDKEFEAEHRMTTKGADCPVCKERTEHRLIGGTTFRLIGDCWAKDNYGNGKRI